MFYILCDMLNFKQKHSLGWKKIEIQNIYHVIYYYYLTKQREINKTFLAPSY